MAIPVLLILAVLWAAVLVPPVVRSRSESRRSGVGDYTSRLGALMDRPGVSRSTTRGGGRSLRAVPQASSSRARTAARSQRRRAAAQRRRRNVLGVLIGTAVVTLGLALLVTPLLWIPHVVADVLLVVYLSLLFHVKRRGSLTAGDDEFWSSTPGNRSTTAVAHPRVPPRPELAPMHRAPKPRRSATG